MLFGEDAGQDQTAQGDFVEEMAFGLGLDNGVPQALGVIGEIL